MQDSNDLKENLQDGKVWMRLMYMLLFGLIYSVAEVVLFMVVVFQFLCVLFTGRKNDQVLTLGAQLSSFIYEVLRYLTYNSDERPYPFSAWPADAPVQPDIIVSPAPVRSAPASESTPEKTGRNPSPPREKSASRCKVPGEERLDGSD